MKALIIVLVLFLTLTESISLKILYAKTNVIKSDDPKISGLYDLDTIIQTCTEAGKKFAIFTGNNCDDVYCSNIKLDELGEKYLYWNCIGM